MGRTRVTAQKNHKSKPDWFKKRREHEEAYAKAKLKPIKRTSYNDYIDKFALCDVCYDEWERELQDPEYQAKGIRELNRKTGIPVSTIGRWHEHWQRDHSFRNYYYTNKGQARRIFSEEEENGIADFIRTNYIERGIYFSDAQFRDLCLNGYLLEYLQSDAPPEFHCSNGFIWDFKRKHRFSSRKSHYKRRPESNPEFIEAWMKEMRELFATVPHDHILNCDETSWKTYPNGLRTWASKGAMDVQIRIGGNDKQCMTVLATIAADGTKRPLMFLAEGTSNTVLQTQIGDVAPHWKSCSDSGWMQGSNFMDYLSLIRQRQTDDDPIHILCDVYSAHHTDEVIAHARGLKIFLHFVPAGTTDYLQPLDRRVFACVKASLRRLFRIKQQEACFEALNIKKPESAQMMVWCWEHLSTEVIKDAWDIYEE